MGRSVYIGAGRDDLAALGLIPTVSLGKIMKGFLSRHASVRAQQRGIPPLIVDWLREYGESHFDGHGGIYCFFSGASVRKIEREVGHAPVARLSEFMRCYLVLSSTDGCVITVGKRHGSKHRWRH